MLPDDLLAHRIPLRVITVNGRRITYYESAGQGTPVLFIHGNSLSGLAFARQLTSPLGATNRLVAINLPGHGRTAQSHSPQIICSLPEYAQLLVDFAKALAMEQAVFVGWSLGGHILLEAVAHLPEARGFMILGAPPLGKPMAAEAFIPNPLFNLLYQKHWSKEEIAALLALFFKPDSRIPAFFHDDLQLTDGRAREALLVSSSKGNYQDEVEVVAQLRKPLAVLHGAMDPLINLAYLQSLSMPTLWRSKVQVIPDAGHTPQWEQAEVFNHLLQEFI